MRGPIRVRHGLPHRRASPSRSARAQSCTAEIGGSASAYLVKQCRVVNGRWERSCTADMTCDDLRDQIANGCSSRDRKPGFCNRR
ncbi:MAG: hypothetical protein EOP61_07985 [Sphingomonadales bacterium]|nr:MAG: hypothetical protein EOP61_07985 [Sphingomonadales bacterium]